MIDAFAILVSSLLSLFVALRAAILEGQRQSSLRAARDDVDRSDRD